MKYLTYSAFVIALFISQTEAIHLVKKNGCPDDDEEAAPAVAAAAAGGAGTFPVKIKKKKGGDKLKTVLKALAGGDEEDTHVVHVPYPVAPAAKPCSKKKEGKCGGDDAEKAGKKAGKEAKKAVEKALKN